VTESVNPLLAEWESFYVIVGSSAAALTGLQFVVIALASDARTLGGEAEVGAFGTPTIVHFCAALLVSAVLSAPWHSLGGADAVLLACGLAGLVYSGYVLRIATRQIGYKPVFEDWLWHCALPFVAYGTLLIAALVLRRHVHPSLFAIGGASVLLVFIGIHNAWDAVTYLAHHKRKELREEKRD
jgi:hypothetical protein